MELADVTDSKSVGLIPRAGSTPATGTNTYAPGSARGISIPYGRKGRTPHELSRGAANSGYALRSKAKTARSVAQCWVRPFKISRKTHIALPRTN